MLEDRIAAEIPHLRRYARALVRDRESADDLVQDTLERALRKHHLWRPTGRLRSWLFRILYRLYLNQDRARRKSSKVVPLNSVAPPRALIASHDLGMHCRDVVEMLDTMPRDQRAILMLVALEQPGYKEGARILGIPVGTYRSRLSRARVSLRNHLAQADVAADREDEGNG